MINTKFEYRNTRQVQVHEYVKQKKYDLEDRTFAFANAVREFINQLKRSTNHRSDIDQLIRSSGSVGANYIEANESVSKKDFKLRIKICKKEAKETIYWLRLLRVEREDQDRKRNELRAEATELMKIFGSILERSK